MYIILEKNGYIAEAIIKQLKSRGLPHVGWTRTNLHDKNLPYKLKAQAHK